MSPAQEICLIIGMMLVTFGVRYSALAISGKHELPQSVERALRYVPVAVLTAICSPILFKPEGNWLLSIDNAYLVAGFLAVLISRFSNNLLLTIVLGMIIFFVLQLNWF
jgi:branched-subunit amino acid transport protein